jgi:hypothetical protein
MLVVAASAAVGLGGSAPAGADRMVTCAPVPALSAEAKQTLKADARRILQQVIDRADGTDSRWTDPVSGRQREVFRGPQGKIHSELVTVRGRVVDVDYDARTWMASLLPHPIPIASPTSSPAETVRMYRDLIANRDAKIVGQTRVVGVPTIHVRQLQTIPPPTRAQLRKENELVRKQLLKQLPKGAHIPKGFGLPSAKVLFKTEHVKRDIWLDAATYLPLRIRTVTDGRFSSDESDTWLRRTVKNLAKTHIVIPPGFKRERASGLATGFSLVTATSKNAARCHAP